MDSTSLLGLIFFGLTTSTPQEINQIRTSIYQQIHQICFYGQGGYSWDIIYNMPIYLRKFIFNEMKEYYDEQNKNSNKNSSPKNKKTITPSYLPPNKSKSPQSSPKPQPKKNIKIPYQRYK
jgi:hypothetical protein